MAAASIASEAGVADVHMLDDAGDPVPTDSLLLEVARRPLSLVIGEQQLPVSACKGTVGHASADEHRVHLQVLMRKANYMRVRKILESDTRRQIKFSVRPKQRRGGDPQAGVSLRSHTCICFPTTGVLGHLQGQRRRCSRGDRAVPQAA